MDKIRLGRTNLMVSRSGFGAIPLQRLNFDESKNILLKAYENGINFFDTARMYSDSEEKIGYALSHVRKNIITATKSTGTNKAAALKDLETSLNNLKTDYIDIYQLHNPDNLPDSKNLDSAYSALVEAKKKGLIRFIGVTNHRLDLAIKAVESGLYDTLQYPLNYLSSAEELKLIDLCRQNDAGFIAMKALSGGLITNAESAFAFLRQYENVVPIWGIQKESELDEFLSLEDNPPVLDDKIKSIIAKDKKDLAGNFCRGCGYCLPCPSGIPISFAARMSFLLRRSAYQQFLQDAWRKQMLLIHECIECGHCRDNCPYHLNTPQLLKYMLKDYEEFYSIHK
jgi:aryl-alcohol dehydrogenase-like predicted oxidoreductase